MSLMSLQDYRFPETCWQFSTERAKELGAVLGYAPNSGRLSPTLAFSADLNGGVIEQLFAVSGLAPHQLLHGEQHFIYHRALQPATEYRVTGRITAVERKSRFDLLHKSTQLEEPEGRPVCEMSSVYVAIAEPVGPVSGPLLAEHSGERMPCASITRERIAAFAVASGDHNPVHLVPSVAQAAGHGDVFAQGMLGMGLLGGMIASGELQRFGVRFISPIALNERPVLHLDATSPIALYLTDEVGHLRIKGYAHVTR